VKPPRDLPTCVRVRDALLRYHAQITERGYQEARFAPDELARAVQAMTYLIRRVRVAEAKLKELRSK